jgi:transcriptional regulator with XRE-family HTH domain
MKRNPRTLLGWSVECHRQKSDLSRAELADLANCEVEEVRDLEGSGRLPSLTSLTNMCEAFRLSLAEMVKFSQQQPKP